MLRISQVLCTSDGTAQCVPCWVWNTSLPVLGAPTHTYTLPLSPAPPSPLSKCLFAWKIPSHPLGRSQSNGSQNAPSTEKEPPGPGLPASVHSATKVMTALCSYQLHVSVLTTLNFLWAETECFCLYLGGQSRASAHSRSSVNLGLMNACTNEGMTPLPQSVLVRTEMAQTRGPRAAKLRGYPSQSVTLLRIAP